MLEVFEAMRYEAVRTGAAPLEAHKRLLNNVINYRNPWGQPRKRRIQWAKEEQVKRIALGGKDRARVLYFVGCTAALDPSLHHVVKSTARLLTKAGVDFGILGEEEPCCGSVFLRVGLRDQARILAHETMRIIHQTGVDTVVTSCAGCYKTFANDYRSFGELKPRIVHVSQYVLECMHQGTLKVQHLDSRLKVTYHDPCHLGRHTGLYDPPRVLLESIVGTGLVEMSRSRANAWCCGAGGGVRSAFEEMALGAAIERIDEASETGAQVVVTSCPFCLQNLQAAVQATGRSLQLADITDLIAQATGVGV